MAARILDMMISYFEVYGVRTGATDFPVQ